MTDVTIRARDLIKTRGDRRVLDAVDLTLQRGRVTAVLGPSGAGKSTLLRAIAGLEELDSGTIEASGQMLTDGKILTRPEHRSIGMVFQDFALFPHLSVLENVMFGLRSGTAKTRHVRAMTMLEQVHLAERANDYPHALSGGEQQRIALARALAPAPSTILLDEAFSGLDSELRAELRDTALAAIAAQGAAALMVTHHPQEAMYMADNLALMIDGAIVQAGPPTDVYLNPVSTEAARLLGEINQWTGPVQNGKVHTPFGTLKAGSAQDDTLVQILVRPEGVQVTDHEQGTHVVRQVHALGANTSAILEAPTSERWLIRSPVEHSLTVGQKVRVDLKPALCTMLDNAGS